MMKYPPHAAAIAEDIPQRSELTTWIRDLLVFLAFCPIHFVSFEILDVVSRLDGQRGSIQWRIEGGTEEDGMETRVVASTKDLFRVCLQKSSP